MTTTDVFWDTLTQVLDAEPVVPIVGRDLTVVNDDGRERYYEHVIADRIAAEIEEQKRTEDVEGLSRIRNGGAFDINQLAAAVPRLRGHPRYLSSRVASLVKKLEFEPPKALVQLAEIERFTLFVTTTFDPLLEQALTKVRGRSPIVVSIPPRAEDPRDAVAVLESAKPTDTIVAHILGQVSVAGTFALTEAQVLEQMHHLILTRATGTGAIATLLDRMAESNLLLLGVSFPDWLARFLIRVARNRATWMDSESGRMEFIADASTKDSPAFRDFLTTYCGNRTQVFEDGSAGEMVAQLNERWKAAHPPAVRSRPQARDASAAGEAASSGSIFVSYASEDRDAALTLVKHLRDAGCEVWIDVDSISLGRDHDESTTRAIEQACAFIAVLSSNTSGPALRPFRNEWRVADKKSGNAFALEDGFIYLLVVDGTPARQLERIAERWVHLPRTRAPGGVPEQQFIETMVRVQREARTPRQKV